MSENEVIEKILHNPRLAGYSAKRYLAGMDIGRSLFQEGYLPEQILKLYFTYISKSPYVPGTDRKRISQIPNEAEPPLMKVMRKSLQKE